MSYYKNLVEKEFSNYISVKRMEAKKSGVAVDKEFDTLKEYLLRSAKRFRPIAVIMGFKAVGGKPEKNILLPSLSVECLHNASLVADDIIDEDSFRRGGPASHTVLRNWFLKLHGSKPYKGTIFSDTSVRFGTSMSVLGSYILVSFANSAIIESKFKPELKIQALDVLEKSFRALNVGEIQDMVFEYLENVSEKEYLDMVEKKTAVLLSASFQIGAILGEGTESQINALKEFSLKSASAFQIQDDLLDLTKAKGHDIGSDIKTGKKTLLVIKALELSEGKNKELLRKTIGNHKASDFDLQKVINLMQELGVLDYVKNLAEKKILESKKALTKAKPAFKEPYFSYLNDFADLMLERKK
ncbi:MAG: polyprenyl synthetase family protein [archaeon]